MVSPGKHWQKAANWYFTPGGVYYSYYFSNDDRINRLNLMVRWLTHVDYRIAYITRIQLISLLWPLKPGLWRFFYGGALVGDSWMSVPTSANKLIKRWFSNTVWPLLILFSNGDKTVSFKPGQITILLCWSRKCFGVRKLGLLQKMDWTLWLILSKKTIKSDET